MDDQDSPWEDAYFDGVGAFAEGRHTDAVAAFERAIELKPDYLDALHGMARAHFEARQFEGCIAAALRITELSPDDVMAYSTLSQAYGLMDDKDNAEKWGAKARVAGWKQQLKRDKLRG